MYLQCKVSAARQSAYCSSWTKGDHLRTCSEAGPLPTHSTPELPNFNSHPPTAGCLRPQTPSSWGDVHIVVHSIGQLRALASSDAPAHRQSVRNVSPQADGTPLRHGPDPPSRAPIIGSDWRAPMSVLLLSGDSRTGSRNIARLDGRLCLKAVAGDSLPLQLAPRRPPSRGHIAARLHRHAACYIRKPPALTRPSLAAGRDAQRTRAPHCSGALLAALIRLSLDTSLTDC